MVIQPYIYMIYIWYIYIWYGIYIYIHIIYYILYMYGGWSWTEIDWLHLETTLIFNVASWISRTQVANHQLGPTDTFPMLSADRSWERNNRQPFLFTFWPMSLVQPNVQLGKSLGQKWYEYICVADIYTRDIYIYKYMYIHTFNIYIYYIYVYT